MGHFRPWVIRQIYEWYATGDRSIKDVGGMARDAGLVFRRSGRPVNTKTMHNILRNRTYTGDFDWSGKTYKGVHDPLVSVELWEHVQAVLEDRRGGCRKKVKHEFVYSHLMTCGHCGCALVGQIQKGRYTYYHCTGNRGKCPEPYVREEVFGGHFADALGRLVFDDEVLEWVKVALKQSQSDKKREHDDAIGRLQKQYTRLQNRVDAMYDDKVDGLIDADLFDGKAREWQTEQQQVLRAMEKHQSASKVYLDEGVRLLELSQRAESLFL